MATETQTRQGIDELLKKLVNEKFNGKEPEWREAEWTETKVLCAIDDKNWYYRKGSMIYVQEKQAPNSTHCYHCNSEIEVVGQKCSVHYKEFGSAMAGGGEVRTKLIPYCPNCESKPSESGFITE
jgi:hypothetical protein